jgi:hypothetical protein
MTNDEARQAGRHTEPPATVAANDNVLGAGSTRIDAAVRKSRAVKAARHRVDAPTTTAANDNEAAGAARQAANDNEATATPQAAANDNEATAPALCAVATEHPTPNDSTAIHVIDDLPRPLPVLPGEGEIVRRLVRARLRQIFGKEKL